ncbi:MAG: RNA polymerase sigma-70 factor [Bacteroidota bacterium]
MLTDQELYRQISMGNELAFKTLYDRYWKRVIQIADRILMNKEMAKDVVQDVFVSIWTKRGSVQIKNVKAYIYQSIKLSCFDKLRSIKHHESLLGRSQIILESKDFEDKINFEDTSFRINSGISSLPEKTKKIFKLSRERSLSNHQIAKELDISPKTVEYHISVSLKHLRKNLA